jgi:hypothetical protein
MSLNTYTDENTVTAILKELTRPKRCQMSDCKVKLSLTDSPCKCSQTFCMRHRHAELHSCTYDFKGESDARLKKEMNEVRAQKLERV